MMAICEHVQKTAKEPQLEHYQRMKSVQRDVPVTTDKAVYQKKRNVISFKILQSPCCPLVAVFL